MNVSLTARRVLVVLIVLLLAEWIPGVVNAILALVLIGLILGHWASFSFLATWLTAIFGDEIKNK